MSSQESASAEQLQRKKRQRRNNSNRGPPSRLDWMGGGFGVGGQGGDNNIVTQSTAPENDSDEKLMTPRADEAIDLTGKDSDDDDRDTKKNGKQNDSKWKCQRCTLLNPQSTTVCGACDARRESTRNNTKKENNRNDGDGSDDSEFPTITMKSKKNGISSSTSAMQQ